MPQVDPDIELQIQQKPGHLIRRLQQIAFAIFMDKTREFGITPVQYSAILAVESHPGIDQTTLCNIIAFDRSTIGDVVSRLEKKKMIVRRPGSADRRTKALYITPLGRRLLGEIEPAVAATQRLILAPLKASERNAFMQMLKRMVHINNEHSRAPLRPGSAEQRRHAAAVRSAKSGRRGRLVRTRSAKDAAGSRTFADR